MHKQFCCNFSYTESWNATLDLLNTSSQQTKTGVSNNAQYYVNVFASVDHSRVITGLSVRSKLPAITNAWQVGGADNNIGQPYVIYSPSYSIYSTLDPVGLPQPDHYLLTCSKASQKCQYVYMLIIHFFIYSSRHRTMRRLNS